MPSFGEITRWLSGHESLFKSITALIGLAGFVVAALNKSSRRAYTFLRGLRARGGGATALVTDRAVGAGPGPGAPSPEGEPIIAVLAFDNHSSDPEMQFFSDGISEEIIRRLARGSTLKVIARTSSFQFRGERKAEAANSLGSSHVLDGSIRRDADRIRVSAHFSESRSQTTMWSERYDRDMKDIFAVQDEISESIARALHQAFAVSKDGAIDPGTYDVFLRSSPKSYAPGELRRHVEQLETVVEQAPNFAGAWSRLAYLRAWLRFYQPLGERAASAALVTRDASRALALDPESTPALTAQLFVVPPLGSFVEGNQVLERLRRAHESPDGLRYMAWYMRTLGLVNESVRVSERAYRLDPLDPMSANLAALARMAAGNVEGAIPIYADLMERVPEMSFPVSSLLRAHAFQSDWASVDRLLALAEKRDLSGFEDGLLFIRAKRDPTPVRLGAYRDVLQTQARETGCVDLSRLVYAAHLGLVDDAFEIADATRLGPPAGGECLLGPDAYRTSLLFQAGMPELRNDTRFARICARLGLVEFWLATGTWPDCAETVPYDFRAECRKVASLEKEDFAAGRYGSR